MLRLTIKDGRIVAEDKNHRQLALTVALCTLTALLLIELIDRIEFSEVEAVGKGKNRKQRVVIYCRFAGYIELEENYMEGNFKKDNRQGVAVEYVHHDVGEWV